MNTLNVAKFGGTSMANFAAMDRCAQIVLADDNIRLVVVSASSGITNKLTALASAQCSNERREEIIAEITEQHNTILASISDEQVAKIQLDYLLLSLARVSEQLAKSNAQQAEAAHRLLHGQAACLGLQRGQRALHRAHLLHSDARRLLHAHARLL